MTRVAFVTPWPPYPLDAGNRIRTFHLLKHVGERHDVTLLTAVAGREEAEALARTVVLLAQKRIAADEVRSLPGFDGIH